MCVFWLISPSCKGKLGSVFAFCAVRAGKGGRQGGGFFWLRAGRGRRQAGLQCSEPEWLKQNLWLQRLQLKPAQQTGENWFALVRVHAYVCMFLCACTSPSSRCICRRRASLALSLMNSMSSQLQNKLCSGISPGFAHPFTLKISRLRVGEVVWTK